MDIILTSEALWMIRSKSMSKTKKMFEEVTFEAAVRKNVESEEYFTVE